MVFRTRGPRHSGWTSQTDGKGSSRRVPTPWICGLVDTRGGRKSRGAGDPGRDQGRENIVEIERSLGTGPDDHCRYCGHQRIPSCRARQAANQRRVAGDADSKVETAAPDHESIPPSREGFTNRWTRSTLPKARRTVQLLRQGNGDCQDSLRFRPADYYAFLRSASL
jgi:hypothetical protein